MEHQFIDTTYMGHSILIFDRRKSSLISYPFETLLGVRGDPEKRTRHRNTSDSLHQGRPKRQGTSLHSHREVKVHVGEGVRATLINDFTNLIDLLNFSDLDK